MKSKKVDLGWLLGQFGNGFISREQFWRTMEQNGYTQDTIDAWCKRYYELLNQNGYPQGMIDEWGKRHDELLNGSDNVPEVETTQTFLYELTGSEMHLASIAGVQRTLDGIRKRREGRYGAERRPDFQGDVIGCVGEMTLAKHLDQYWNGAFGNLRAADVGTLYQSRGSDYTGPNAGMLVHPPVNIDGSKGDDPEHLFVKALVLLPNVTLMGWMFGRDAQQQKYWNDRLRPGRPAYLVPHEDLKPMATLPR